MRSLLLVAALAGCAGPQPVAAPAPPGPAKPAGKLVVLVVFDQMRGDYLDRWAAHFGPDGFERIKTSGAWFSECHIPYSCTSTGPGHASIITGATPAAHGIIENDWFDRKAGEPVYCAQPTRPYDRVPPLAAAGKSTRGSGIGFSPERLTADTVGDVLKAAGGRVFSLSIKDRTAVMMGGKKPDAAYCFDARDGKFATGAYYRDAPHAWVDEFNAAGLVNTFFDKKWERFKTDLDYTTVVGPDDAPGESAGTNKMGKVFPHPLKGELTAPADKFYAAVEMSPFGNDLLFELAKKAIVAEKLGTGDTTDLLCLSFSSNDLIGHAWGPDSHEVLDVTLRSDHMIGEMRKFLDEKVGKDRYVLAITADHGVCPLPEQKRLPAAERKALGETLNSLAAALAPLSKDPVPTAAWFEGAEAIGDIWPWVYFNRTAIEARKIPFDDVVAATEKWVQAQPYLDVAFTRRQLEADTPPPVPADREKLVKELFEKVKLAYRADRCGDLIVIAKAGVQVSKYAAGTGHGSPHAYDAHVPLLVYGAGVPAVGKRTERVSSLSVAPTLAWALGVKQPDTAKEAVPPGLK